MPTYTRVWNGEVKPNYKGAMAIVRGTKAEDMSRLAFALAALLPPSHLQQVEEDILLRAELEGTSVVYLGTTETLSKEERKARGIEDDDQS